MCGLSREVACHGSGLPRQVSIYRNTINIKYLFSSPETYHTNPQFGVQITDVDEDDDEDIGTIIVGLMQKGRRRLKAQGEGNLTMGYEMYKVCIYVEMVP